MQKKYMNYIGPLIKPFVSMYRNNKTINRNKYYGYNSLSIVPNHLKL